MIRYATIKKTATSELIAKKSRFIGQVYPAQSFEQAEQILAGVKKKYYDATHNCSAMILGKNREFSRCSDDKEPQGTAGVPMLQALKHSGLTDVLAISTRYFGGVLLGTGGLIRAYGGSISQTLSVAHKIEFIPHEVYKLQIDFKLWGKISSYLANEGIIIKDTSYEEVVHINVCVLPEGVDGFLKDIANISGGAIAPVHMNSEYIEVDL